MTEQDRNLSIIRAYHDDFNRQDPDALARYCAEEFENHGRRVGKAGARWVLEDIFTRFPDCRQDIEDIVATGNAVIVRSTYSGTHKGIGRRPIDGGFMIGVAATERRFTVQHIHWFQLTDGLIVKHWANRDDTGMLVQLGLMAPAPAYVPENTPSERGGGGMA